MNEKTAQSLFDLYNIYDNDMFILVSNDGFDHNEIEMAKIVKNKNFKIITVTPIDENNEKQKLSDYADISINNHVSDGDTFLKLENGVSICSISTLVGNFIAQMMTAELYQRYLDNGLEPDILLSANIDNSDEHNKIIRDKYIDRWDS